MIPKNPYPFWFCQRYHCHRLWVEGICTWLYMIRIIGLLRNCYHKTHVSTLGKLFNDWKISHDFYMASIQGHVFCKSQFKNQEPKPWIRERKHIISQSNSVSKDAINFLSFTFLTFRENDKKCQWWPCACLQNLISCFQFPFSNPGLWFSYIRFWFAKYMSLNWHHTFTCRGIQILEEMISTIWNFTASLHILTFISLLVHLNVSVENVVWNFYVPM